MKQSKINSYFSPGRMKTGSSGSSIRQGYQRGKDCRRMTSNDLFFSSKDPTVIYEKIREKKRQRMKFTGVDPMGVETDLSSQNSSQMFLNSQFNSQNSQSFVGSSFTSDDATPWYQSWVNKNQAPYPSGLYHPQPRSSSRQSYSNSSQDFKQYMEEAKKRSKEKEERDMLSSFLNLVKECCEATKAAANENTEKCDVKLKEGFASIFDKVGDLAQKLTGIENRIATTEEQENKIKDLESKLQILTAKNEWLQKQLDEARSEEDNRIMAELTDALDKGQKIYSDKIDELVTNTSEIRSFLKKPKLPTADMWCQYSPQLRPRTPQKKMPNTVATATSPFPSTYVSKTELAHDLEESGSNYRGCRPENISNPRASFVTTASSASSAHSFAVPSSLPPRYGSADFQHNRRIVNLDHRGYSDHTRMLPQSNYVQPAISMPNYTGAVQRQTRSIWSSPLLGSTWALSKTSPVAAVKPRQQHTSEGKSQQIQHPVSQADSRTSGSESEDATRSWQKLAESQSRAWFARPHTRSTNKQSGSALTNNAAAETLRVIPQTQATNEEGLPQDESQKKKCTKRKKAFTRKKGRGKKRVAAATEDDINAAIENQANTLSAQSRSSNNGAGDLDVDATNRGAVLTDSNSSPQPIRSLKIKQEPLSSFTNPFPNSICYRMEASREWILLSESDDESYDSDVILFTGEHRDKENIPPTKYPKANHL